MTKRDREEMIEVLCIFMVPFSIAFILQFMIGCSDATWHPKDNCGAPNRIQYFFPGYQIGCWFGSTN